MARSVYRVNYIGGHHDFWSKKAAMIIAGLVLEKKGFLSLSKFKSSKLSKAERKKVVFMYGRK